MDLVFYIAAAIAVISTLLVVTGTNVVHALLYLVLSLLAVAVVFFTLGAPFVAALEVIVYAGAIMVLFVFVVMMLNLGTQSYREEKRLLSPRTWIGPVILGAALLAEMVYVLAAKKIPGEAGAAIAPKAVGLSLFGPYLLCVELAALLMLAALVGVFHLARKDKPAQETPGGEA